MYDTTIKYEKDGEANVHERRVMTTAPAVEVVHALLHQVLPVEGAGLTISVKPVKRVGGHDGVSQIAGDGIGLFVAPQFRDEEETYGGD